MFDWIENSWHEYVPGATGTGPMVRDTIFLKSDLGYTPIWMKNSQSLDNTYKAHLAFWSLVHPKLFGLSRNDLLDEIVNISLETEAPYWRYMSFEYSGVFCASITDDKLLMSWARDGF